MPYPIKTLKYYDSVRVLKSYKSGKTVLVFGRDAQGNLCAINDKLQIVSGKFDSKHWKTIHLAPNSKFGDHYVGE